MDVEKQKPRFFLAVSILALSALAAFIFIMSQYKLIVSMEIAITLGLATGVLLTVFIVLFIYMTDMTEFIRGFIIIKILFLTLVMYVTIALIEIEVFEGAEEVIKVSFGFAIVVGLLGVTGTVMTFINKMAIGEKDE